VELADVISLDKAHQLIDAEVMSICTIDSAMAYPRDIAQRALANCASAVTLGHKLYISGDFHSFLKDSPRGLLARLC